MTSCGTSPRRWPACAPSSDPWSRGRMVDPIAAWSSGWTPVRTSPCGFSTETGSGSTLLPDG
jgi:hypothetical protein